MRVRRRAPGAQVAVAVDDSGKQAGSKALVHSGPDVWPPARQRVLVARRLHRRKRLVRALMQRVRSLQSRRKHASEVRANVLHAWHACMTWREHAARAAGAATHRLGCGALEHTECAVSHRGRGV
jgi:hypothetical protein